MTQVTSRSECPSCFSGVTLSPDGSRIAYVGDPDTWPSKEVYVMNSDGSGKTRMSFSGEGTPGKENPRWSPDGSKIVFSHRWDNPLWLLNADGTNETELDAAGKFPDWSPDGSKIAYHNGGGTPGGQLWMMNADGTNQERVDPFTDSSTSGDSVQDATLGWSPDGTKIAFKSYADQGKISILTLSDSSIIKLSGVCPTCQSHSSFMSWSPDGTQLLIGCKSVHGYRKICVMDSDGSNTIMLQTPNLPEAAVKHFCPCIGSMSWSN